MADDKRHKGLPPGFPLFTILGFEVRLNLSWLVLGLLITWTLAEGFLPERYPELSTQSYWWMGVAGAIGILFSIVFHELSHSLVGRSMGLPIGGITLFTFGGIAEMRQEPPSPKVEFLMAGAGPLSSLLLAAVVRVVEAVGIQAGWPLQVIGVLYYLAVVNVVLAVFNLVPAFPLDGGRMLRAALWAWRKDLREATRIASTMGSAFGIALIVMGFLSFLGGDFVGGMWAVLIGLFLRGAAKASWQQLLLSKALRGKTAKDLANDDTPAVSSSTSLQEFTDRYVYRYPLRTFPVVDGSRLIGCASVDGLKAVPERQRDDKTIDDIMTECSSDNTVRSDADAMDVVKDLGGPTGVSQKIVADGDRLVGTISLDDLRHLMSVSAELEASRK